MPPPYPLPPLPRRAFRNTGFSLVEAVIGLTLLSGLTVALLGAVLTGSRLTENSLRRQAAEVYAHGVLESFLIETITDLSAPSISITLPGESRITTFNDVDTPAPPWIETSFELRQRPDRPVERIPIQLRLAVANQVTSATRPHLQLRLFYRWPAATLGAPSPDRVDWLSGETLLVRSLITNTRQ
jgi:hypothetical protein